MLAGYKTYIVAILIGVAKVAEVLGFIDAAAYETIFALLMGGGLATLRMGMKGESSSVAVKGAPIVLLFLFLSASPVQAIELWEAQSVKVTDIQMYLNERGSDARLGTGFAYGPLYHIMQGGREIGTVFSVCGFVSASPSGDDQFGGGIGVCPISILGLNTSITYNPLTAKPTYGIGISVLELIRKMKGE